MRAIAAPRPIRTVGTARAWVLALACGGGIGCQRPQATETPRCAVGEERACRCLDGERGFQVCNDDGVYLPCGCGGPVDSGAGGTGGGRVEGAGGDAADPSGGGAEPSPGFGGTQAGLGGADSAGFDAGAGAGGTPFDGCETPAYVHVAGFDIFAFEASHPTATPFSAFPGALSTGLGPHAPPLGDRGPCSRPGVRPWHTVSYDEARSACDGIGWRMCREDELVRACGGPDHRDWTFGASFDGTACNLRQVYLAPGAETSSEAPAGEFPRCVSAEGSYDLTGNLWEWTSNSGRFVGAGWRIVAERHHEGDLVCTARGVASPGFASADVGFRCCRDAR